MGVFITAGILVIFALVFFICGKVSIWEGKSFEENKQTGKATIVGYDGNDQSSVYNILVEVHELNDGKVYLCEPGMSDLKDYPVGRTIDVLYAKKREFGINIVEVHLIDHPPVSSERLGRIFCSISYMLLIVAAFLVLIGIL